MPAGVISDLQSMLGKCCLSWSCGDIWDNVAQAAVTLRELAACAVFYWHLWPMNGHHGQHVNRDLCRVSACKVHMHASMSLHLCLFLTKKKKKRDKCSASDWLIRHCPKKSARRIIARLQCLHRLLGLALWRVIIDCFWLQLAISKHAAMQMTLVLYSCFWG